MTTSKTSSVVPTSYAELFQHYYPYVVKLVRKFSIYESDVEDVAMTILMKFMENDALADYDPEYQIRGGKPARFMTFLSGFVASYIRHYVERQNAMRVRNYVSVDQSVLGAWSESHEKSPGTWIDVYGPKHYDDLREVEDAQFLSAVRSHLSKLPVTGQRDFALLFELIIDQLHERGRLHKTELAGLFGVGPTSIDNWIKQLQVHVSEATA